MGCLLGVMGAVVAAVIFFLYVLHSLQGGNGPGIIPGVGEKTFTRSDPPITLPITSVTQVFICNKSGNVSLSVDPNTSSAKIAGSRKVQAQSEADAEKEYQNIKVQAQAMGTLDIQGACKSPLAVPSGAATAPASTNTATPTSTTTGNTTKTSLVVNVAFLNDDELNKAPVDLAISLPQRALPTISATQPINMLVGVEVSRRGDITIGKGISGVFDLNGSLNGNITIDGTMAPNSHISTPEGLITFRGDLAIPTVAPSQGQTYNFILSGTKIDATLPANRDLTLHIVTPGKINSGEFTLQQDSFSKDGTTTDYNGPLNPNAPPPPPDYQVKPADIQITLRASRGDVTLHKKL